MMKEINIPKTYEEALARKKEVLELINAYNEAILNGYPPTLSDEEIDLLQEEYLVLNDLVIEKEHDENGDIVYEEQFTDEGVVIEKRVKKRTFFDEINPAIYLYMFVVLLFSSWFMMRVLCFDLLIATFTWEKYQNATPFWIWVGVMLPFLAYIIILIGLNFIFLWFFRKNKAQRIFLKWWIVGHFVIIIVNLLIIYFTDIKPLFDLLIENI
ncbi:MAG: hypothetical protein PHG08_08280 [Bacilli bacterium]|nr:hypothetical protein [Bacilli bacterium]HHU23785.1 hypothetical protein [Acholeplasmataceae bacterium]